MGVTMNLRIIRKNHAASPEISFLTKSILKPFGLTAGRRDSVGVNLESLYLKSLNLCCNKYNMQRGKLLSPFQVYS